MSVMAFSWFVAILSFWLVFMSHWTMSPLSWPVTRNSSRVPHRMDVTLGPALGMVMLRMGVASVETETIFMRNLKS